VLCQLLSWCAEAQPKDAVCFKQCSKQSSTMQTDAARAATISQTSGPHTTPCMLRLHSSHKALLRVGRLDQRLNRKSDPALIYHTAVWTEELPVLRLCQLQGACAVMQARLCPFHSAGFSSPQALLCLAPWSLQCQACTVSASPCACMTSEQLMQTAS